MSALVDTACLGDNVERMLQLIRDTLVYGLPVHVIAKNQSEWESVERVLRDRLRPDELPRVHLVANATGSSCVRRTRYLDVPAQALL